MSGPNPDYSNRPQQSSAGGSPITPQSASGQGPSFKTNVNRAKTKRWVEAKSYAYDGDDWGAPEEEEDDNEEPQPQPPPKTTGLRQQGQGLTSPQNHSYDGGRYGAPQSHQQASRSVSQPVGQRSGRSSFDQGDDRPSFPGQPMQPAQPAQPSHGPPQHHPLPRFYASDAAQPPLQIQTQPRRSMEQQQQNPLRGPPYGAPYSAAPGPRSRSGDRAPTYPTGYSQSQSATSSPYGQESSARFPPRKSSLSQQMPPVIPMGNELSPDQSDISASSGKIEPRERSSSTTAKPLPFIRPADIYKRMAEEREKERKSQESSRPSLESLPAKSREESPGTALRQRGSSESIGRGGRRPSLEGDVSEEADSNRRLKPMLDPVAERKSEYGFEHLPKQQPVEPKAHPPVEPLTASMPHGPAHPQHRPDLPSRPSDTSQRGSRPELPSASSNYSDRSLEGSLPDVPRFSGFGMDSADDNSHENDLASRQPEQTAVEHNVLAHQGSSQGFSSFVREAFDSEHRDVPPTPSSSMGESVMRSNSDSTSAISPIISRGPSTSHIEPGSFARDATPTISEEPERASSRPVSSGTIGMFQRVVDKSEPLPPPTLPGRTRGDSPSPASSPARRPVIESSNNLPQSELAEMSNVTPTPSHSGSEWSGYRDGDDRVPDETHQGPNTTANTFVMADAVPRTSLDSRGRPDLPPAQGRDSPILRSESPPKGTVRGLADKFRSEESPKPVAAPYDPRPTAKHAESFRPALPGGWPSYVNTPGAETPPVESKTSAPEPERDSSSPITPKANIAKSPDFDVTPTATNKTAATEEELKSSLDPFTAASAAGAALAGAFAAAAGNDGLRLFGLKDSAEKTEEEREVLQQGEIHPSRLPPPSFRDSEVQSSPSSKPPTPPPKDVPFQDDFPKAEQNYFPLPLRHRGESPLEKLPTPQRPGVEHSESMATPLHEYRNDRLQEEIMDTLTPQTSIVEDRGRPDSDQIPHNLNVAPTSRDQVESTTLPREYDSYWNNTADESPPESGELKGASTISPQESKDLPSLPIQTYAAQEEPSSARPVMQHRFSWEDSNPSISLPTPEQRDLVALAEDSPNTIRAHGQPTIASPVSPMPVGERTVDDSALFHIMQTPSVVEDTQTSISSFDPRPSQVSPLYPEYGHSQEAERLSPRNNQNISQSNTLPSPKGATPRRSLDNTSARSMQRSSISGPSRASGDSNHRYLASTTSGPEASDNLPASLSPASPTTELMSFKKILALKSPNERITAYNDTREQFAAMDTGLESWLTSVGSALPEHEELLAANGRPISGSDQAHRPSPARSKFPMIGGDTFRPSHIRQVSGSAFTPKISTQQVQAKSKDLMKSATVFGGKANTTAKGWLSKGKTRFRSSGGGDKGVPPIHETSPSPDAQPEPESIPVSSPSKPTLGARSFSPTQNDTPLSIVPTNGMSRAGPTETMSPAQRRANELMGGNQDERQQDFDRDAVSHHDWSTLLKPSAASVVPVAVHESPRSSIGIPSESSVAKPQGQDPFQDPVNGLTDSGQVSRQTSVSMARERSAGSENVPQLNVESERAKSEVSAISEEALDATYLEDQHSNESERHSISVVSPIHNVSTNGVVDPIVPDHSRRISISPLQSPVGPREEAEETIPESQNQKVSPMPTRETSVEEKAQPTQPQEQQARPVVLQQVVIPEPFERELPQTEITQASPSDEQMKAVQEYMKPDDVERLTRRVEGTPPFKSNIPQYDDPPPPRTTQPRPFSFVLQGNEEILPTAGQSAPSQEALRSPEPDDMKAMEAGFSTPPRSFSRPFQDPNIGEHPAFRQESPGPRAINNTQYPYSAPSPDPRLENDRMRYYSHREETQSNHLPRQETLRDEPQPNSLPRQETYRQESYREEPKPNQLPRQDKFRDEPKSNSLPRQETTEYQLPGVGPPTAPATSPEQGLSKSRSRSRPRSGIFRSKSKNRRSILNEQEPDPMPEPQPEQKKKRLSIFRTMSRTESDSDAGSTTVQASGSRSDLIGQPYHQHPVNSYPPTNNITKEKEGKKITKLQRSSTSNVVPEEKVKKKRFSGISSLFGRSGTTGHSGKPQQPIQPLQRVHPSTDSRIPHPQQPPNSQYPYPYASRQSSMPSQHYPPQQYGPNQYPPENASKQNSMQGQQYPQQQYGPNQYPPEKGSPGPYSSHQYPPEKGSSGPYSSQQYPPEKSSAGPDPPQQHPPHQYPPQQYPPQQQHPRSPQQQFAGQPPPLGGYYAPQNNRNSDFIGGRRFSEQRISEAKQQFESQSGFRGPYHPPPQGYPLQRPAPNYPPISTGQPRPNYPPISTAQPSPSQGYSPTSPSHRTAPRSPLSQEGPFARGRTGPHVEHTRELYRRSRSPRSHGYHHSDDRTDDTTNDPAKALGTFRTHSERSSVRGEQEGPWRLSIPEEQDDRSYSMRREPQLPRLDSDEGFSPSTYPLPDSGIMSPINPAAAQMPPPPPPKIPLNQQTPPSSSHRQSASHAGNEMARNGDKGRPSAPPKDDVNLDSPKKTHGRAKSPVELDARPTKDTESEEIVMSSTAYPGQEWQPENWGHWDGD